MSFVFGAAFSSPRRREGAKRGQDEEAEGERGSKTVSGGDAHEEQRGEGGEELLVIHNKEA